MSRDRTPRLYFSFRSPFSWMTVVRLRQALPDAEDRIRFIPYWDPDERSRAALEAAGATLPYVQMSRAKHLYILHDTKRQVDRLGLQMTWPVDVDPWPFEVDLLRRLNKAVSSLAYDPDHLPLKEVGQWNHYEISFVGQALVIRLNGKTVNEFTAHKDASGCIGLQTMQNSHVSFRNVRVIELKRDEKNLPVEGL